MKKISLKNLNLKEVEQLSREQLKDVFGGGSNVEYSDSNPCKGGSQEACTTADGQAGTCQYCNGIYGCSPVKCS